MAGDDRREADSRGGAVSALLSSLGRILASVAAVTGVALLLLMAFEDHFIYFPSRYPEGDWDPRRSGLAVTELRIPSTGGAELFCWFLPHPGDAKSDQPGVLWLHGNAGSIADRTSELFLLSRLPASVLAVDYRGYGRSTGSPSEQGLYDDARAAFDALVAQPGVDPRRIVAFGQSLGGAVAIQLATERPVAALVAASTFTSLADMARLHYGFLAPLARSRYASLEKIGRIAAPKLFIHGTRDEIVPFEMGRRLYDAASDPKQILAVERGHNDLLLGWPEANAGSKVVAAMSADDLMARLAGFVRAAGR